MEKEMQYVAPDVHVLYFKVEDEITGSPAAEYMNENEDSDEVVFPDEEL